MVPSTVRRCARSFHYSACSISRTIKLVGRDHRRVADTKYNIAGLHKGQGNLEAARELFLESAEIYAAVLGPEHEERLDAHSGAEWSV